MTRRVAAMAVMVIGVLAVAVYVQKPHVPDFVERIRYPLKYRAIVRGHARNYHLPPALLAAVIYEESKFDAHAKSKSGAMGLMQLLPSTAHGIAVNTGGAAFRTSDLWNPEINVRYGAFYLRRLLDKYGDERTALAAYNAGQDNVDRWRAAGEGIPFPETRAYVDRVESAKRLYERLYGLTPP